MDNFGIGFINKCIYKKLYKLINKYDNLDHIEYEVEILRKYKDGRDLDESDREIVEELRCVGLMKMGMSLRRRVVTAKTTTLGLRLI